ncbi:ABC transporter ATP-binding protein [Sphaerisporangium rubeum]|uniref:ATP-binding cassette subfamily B protein/ATP-binding cassette subfamily C protein n=1 Tax=Sphaerisporangium rubeum TaxID=321317 RepID=A0A7X0IJ28_9ACTN|nr:ABC transporter ATP-binding protein [Sphaerisporangium rubeum]MBB6475870.1 ATP-binding cassette subfamily B protein/ATP-binding cassette subfamily C protein [Sphaerisporangium rubeum]
MADLPQDSEPHSGPASSPRPGSTSSHPSEITASPPPEPTSSPPSGPTSSPPSGPTSSPPSGPTSPPPSEAAAATLSEQTSSSPSETTSSSPSETTTSSPSEQTSSSPTSPSSGAASSTPDGSSDLPPPLPSPPAPPPVSLAAASPPLTSRPAPGGSGEDDADLGEVTFGDWQAHLGTMTGVGFLTIARRLPALVTQAVRIAWLAGPRDTVAAVTLSMLGGVFTAFGLLATTGVLQALFAAGPTPDRVRAALPALLLVGAAATLRTALQAGAGWAQSRLEPQVARIAERQLYELTSQVDLIRYDDPEFHDSLQRARLRGVAVADSVVDATIDVLTALIGIAAAAGVLGILHPVLLPLLVLAVLPDAWAAVRSARLRYTTMYALIPVSRRKWILTDLMADKNTAAEVRSFTMREFLIRLYDRVAGAEQDAVLRTARKQTVARIIGEALGGVGTAIVYAALGLLLAVGSVALAVAGTAVLAIRTGQSSLANFMFATNRLYEQGLYFTDFLDFCRRAREAVDREPRGPAPSSFTRITAEDVTFRYPGKEDAVLDHVSIHLNHGEVVALVGENGSGKTTLSKILAGLYEPETGRVRWDDTDIADVDQHDLRRHIAVIAQDHTRWPLTVRENIAMGLDKGEQALHDAARVAGADAVVAEMPHGYRTLLDRRFKDGQEPSGGQWQRIAVARGFYRDAPLLICDEPTAALDARAEHALFERIRDHADGRTVLLITHRLASVRYADRIYVLDHGRVAEQGTHDDLMRLDGIYAELYTLQAEAYRTTEAETDTVSTETGTLAT